MNFMVDNRQSLNNIHGNVENYLDERKSDINDRISDHNNFHDINMNYLHEN